MNSSLLSLYKLEGETSSGQETPFSTLPTREETLVALRDNPNVDILILGGGLTGAFVAHQAALHDIKVLLLAQEYFGARAISWRHRVSTLLRSRPIEALRARRPLKSMETNTALSHLVSKAPSDAHALSGAIASLVARVTPLIDIDERLLIREAVLAARQEGAIALSSVEPLYVEAEALSGCYTVDFQDLRSGETHQARVGGIVVDPSLGNLPPTRLGSSVLRVEDSAPGGARRVYGVAPTTAKSGVPFVSFELTDGSYVAVTRLGHDRVEVTLLYGAVELDERVINVICEDACREAGWRIDTMLSSRPVDSRWNSAYALRQQRGIFTCHHSGPWDALRSADRIVRELVALRDRGNSRTRLPRRVLPGAEQAREVDVFRASARARGISESTIERCVTRWKGRVRYLDQFPAGLTEVFPGVLKGEIALAHVSDHANTAEEIALGALGLDTVGGWREALPVIERELAEITMRRPRL